jgi:hypothetical protein
MKLGLGISNLGFTRMPHRSRIVSRTIERVSEVSRRRRCIIRRDQRLQVKLTEEVLPNEVLDPRFWENVVDSETGIELERLVEVAVIVPPLL